MVETWQGNGVKVVEQAAAILYALAADGNRGVRELARSLDISVSTVHRIVTSLERVDLLTIDDRTQRYSLGPGVTQLAAAFPRRSDLVGLARPVMERLWRLTDETICLSVRVQDNRVAIYQIESPQRLRFTADIGRAVPLYIGASGRCLLAFLPDEEIARILSTISSASLTIGAMRSLSELRQEIARTRAEGYGVSRKERTAGGVAVAVPILGAQGSVASLSIYGPEQRLTPERVDELLPDLQDAARLIASQLADGGALWPAHEESRFLLPQTRPPVESANDQT